MPSVVFLIDECCLIVALCHRTHALVAVEALRVLLAVRVAVAGEDACEHVAVYWLFVVLSMQASPPSCKLWCQRMQGVARQEEIPPKSERRMPVNILNKAK